MIAGSDGEISRFHCKPADPDIFPEWYFQMLEKNLKKMSDLEREQNDVSQYAERPPFDTQLQRGDG